MPSAIAIPLCSRVVNANLIVQFAANVARLFRPEKITLFGSYAYGEPTEDSDVDLLVVMPHRGPGHRMATRVRLAVKATFPMPPVIVDYAPSQPPPPRTLTLEEADGRMRVLFAVMPTWTYLLPIVIGLLIGTMKALAGVLLVRMLWRMTHAFHQPNPGVASTLGHWMFWIGFEFAVGALIWWIVATYHWWRYHRWGRVPRVVGIDEEWVTSSRLGLWRVREKRWPKDDFISVEFRPVRWNLNWKRTVAQLCIRRRAGWPLRFRLSSPDPELPGRIARRLACAIGCELILQRDG